MTLILSTKTESIAFNKLFELFSITQEQSILQPWSLEGEQAKATKNTAKKVTRLLNYGHASRRDTTIQQIRHGIETTHRRRLLG